MNFVYIFKCDLQNLTLLLISVLLLFIVLIIYVMGFFFYPVNNKKKYHELRPLIFVEIVKLLSTTKT